MPVTDQQVAALRALLSGHLAEAKRLATRLDPRSDGPGSRALIAAGFAEATHRIFASDGAGLAQFIAQVRTSAAHYAETIDAYTAHHLFHHRLQTGQRPGSPGLDDDDTLPTVQLIMLAELVGQARFSRADLDEFIATARGHADLHLSNTQDPPAEATLLRQARHARRLTLPAAAAKAGMSQQRWGQIERGEGNPAPPQTIAQMAHAVAISPDQLIDADRADAAGILHEIIRQHRTAAVTAALDQLGHRLERIMNDPVARARLADYAELIDPGAGVQQ